MGWRIFRRFSILPGVRVNLARSGPSISVGGRGLTTTFSRRGKRTTVGVPGTGVSYSKTEPWGQTSTPVSRQCPRCGTRVATRAKFCSSCGSQL